MTLDAPPRDARSAAIRAVIDAILPYPDVPPDTLGPYLDVLPAEARPKAIALHRSVMQRWLTLTYLLNLGVKPGTNPVEKFEAPVLACLLVGAAELLLFDEPSYAVIDEAVGRCRAMNRLKATGLVNALLRRFDELVAGRRGEVWTPAADRLPDGQGGMIALRESVLPDPAGSDAKLVRHLAVAGSMPRPLVRRFVEEHGKHGAIAVSAAAVRTPGVFVAEAEADPEMWSGEDLVSWLKANWRRRVQDPAAALAVAALLRAFSSRRSATAASGPTLLDLCAGRGTKTRQWLAASADSAAVAWDPDPGRRSDLRDLRQAVGGGRLAIREPNPGERFDAVLLDVPCSNTGVLGRRPEARYRWSAAGVADLVEVQRDILLRGLRHVTDGGLMLYTTCSIDAAENQEQSRWLEARAREQGRPVEAVAEHLQLPGGDGPDATDGSYHVLWRASSGANSASR